MCIAFSKNLEIPTAQLLDVDSNFQHGESKTIIYANKH